jgi:hypothetical protein
MSGVLGYEWYATPNIHLCSIKDFVVLCRDLGIVIERSACLDERGVRDRFGKSMRFANLLGEQAVFLLRR